MIFRMITHGIKIMNACICPTCHGRGEDVEVDCSNCHGSGYDPNEDNCFAQCHDCYGETTVVLDVCPRCGGSGETTSNDLDSDGEVEADEHGRLEGNDAPYC